MNTHAPFTDSISSAHNDLCRFQSNITMKWVYPIFLVEMLLLGFLINQFITNFFYHYIIIAAFFLFFCSFLYIRFVSCWKKINEYNALIQSNTVNKSEDYQKFIRVSLSFTYISIILRIINILTLAIILYILSAIVF